MQGVQGRSSALGTAVRGIWTPAAEVLCLACHGRRSWNGGRVPSDDLWQRRDESVQPGSEEAVTRCDRCGRAIVVAADIAALHAVCRDLRSAGLRHAAMEQMGGLLAAVLVPLPGGGRVQVYADDGAPDVFTVARAGPDADDEDIVAVVRGRRAAVAAVTRVLGL